VPIIDVIRRFIDRSDLRIHGMFKRKKYDYIISLGMCCEISLALRDLGLRKESLPFDFAVSYDNKEIAELIRSNLESLTETNIGINKYDNLGKKSVKVKGYNIFFPHNTQEEIKIKFKKRISIFCNHLKSNKRLLFIRKNHFDIPIPKEDAINIRNSISEANPNLIFDLLIVNELFIDDKPEKFNEHALYHRAFFGTGRSCNSENRENGQGFVHQTTFHYLTLV